ncbi:MAG TPA: hypothetical protein H9862_01135 [Candidatus Akkermansia intestinigallinarum]|uniref:Uncharacterized protein n=1 Tax=Candidatus Akkermansia intestinigallinarum TaxID=2838431 RepID=A0A9D2AGB5_9BACT|nr:hypothetical protein [Candidatus Akkermansia intestinigallinarum]
MKKKLIPVSIMLLSSLALSSCFFQAVKNAIVRSDYPGDRPPHVITEVNGKPNPKAVWLKVNASDLPPSSALRGKSVGYAPDGLPYGVSTSWSDIVISPYYPNYPLDYTGVAPGSKVWDPYTRKPFYISRTYTLN